MHTIMAVVEVTGVSTQKHIEAKTPFDLPSQDFDHNWVFAPLLHKSLLHIKFCKAAD